MNKNIEAIIFDWDGVLIDSSKNHEKSWHILAEKINLTLPNDFFKKSFGQNNQSIITKFLNIHENVNQIALQKEEIYRSLAKISHQKSQLDFLPGMQKLFSFLFEKKFPYAIASSTPLKNISFILDLLEKSHYFPHIVSADHAKNGKPHPEIFLLASQKINIKPKKCLVIEDSHAGIQSAKNANMKSIAVATTHPIKSLKADTNLKNTQKCSDYIIDLLTSKG